MSDNPSVSHSLPLGGHFPLPFWPGSRLDFKGSLSRLYLETLTMYASPHEVNNFHELMVTAPRANDGD